MTLAEMERKIESLEKRVKELEGRPELHLHYPVPPLYIPPQAPEPDLFPKVWC